MTTKRKNAIKKELKELAVCAIIGIVLTSILAISLWLECQRYVNIW